MLGVYTPPCFILKKNKIYLWGWNIFHIFVKQLNTTSTMTVSKETTNLILPLLKRKGMDKFEANFEGFGNVTIRVKSISVTEKWDWRASSYSQAYNFVVTMKSKGERYSLDKVPASSFYSWETPQRFYKRRKNSIKSHLAKFINSSDLGILFRLCSIPHEDGNAVGLIGDITYKFID